MNGLVGGGAVGRTLLTWARAVTLAVGVVAGPRVLHAQVSVAVSAPAALAPGEPAVVRVEVTAPGATTLRLVPPDVAPFRVVSATRLADPTARAGWQRQEWRYVLAQPGTGARGRYRFEPFTADAQGAGYRPLRAESRPWSLEVRAPGVPAGLAAGPAPATATAPPGVTLPPPSVAMPRAGVTFVARVTPSVVTVGQQATYELTVAVSAEARARIRRNPEFVPAELRGVLAYDLPATHRAEAAGDLHVYRRALFAVAPGRIRVPPARLSYALAAGASYFSPEAQRSVQSNTVAFEAVAPPVQGRPAAWNGAVGSLRASARTSAATVRAGDALEYSLDLEGTGNVALLPRPPLQVPWAEVIEAGDVAAADTGAAFVRGRRTFTWLLTPRTAGPVSVPALPYAYFDPAQGRYAVTTAPALPVRVEPGSSAAASVTTSRDDARGRNALPTIRTGWAGAAPPPLATRPGFWVLLGLVPAPAALLWLAAGARARRGSPHGAPRRHPPATGPAALRHEVVQALGTRLGGRFAEPASPAETVRALRRAGVTADTAQRLTRFLRDVNAAAYGGGGPGPGDALDAGAPVPPLDALRAEWATLRRAVDREALPYGELVQGEGPDRPARRAAAGRAVGALIVVVVSAAVVARATQAAPAQGVGGTTRAPDASTAARAYAAGIAAYARRDVATARRAFEAAAAAAPAGRRPAWADDPRLRRPPRPRAGRRLAWAGDP